MAPCVYQLSAISASCGVHVGDGIHSFVVLLSTLRHRDASCAPRPPFGSSAAFLLHVSGPLTSSSRKSSLILEAAARLADVAELWVLYQNVSTGAPHGTGAFEDAEALSTLHGLQQRTAYPMHVFAYDPTPHAQGHKDTLEQAKGQGGSACAAVGRAFQSGVAQWAQQCLSKGANGAGLKFVWLAASSSQGGELLPVSKIASLVKLYHDKDDDVDDVLALQVRPTRTWGMGGSIGHSRAGAHRSPEPLVYQFASTCLCSWPCRVALWCRRRRPGRAMVWACTPTPPSTALPPHSSATRRPSAPPSAQPTGHRQRTPRQRPRGAGRGARRQGSGGRRVARRGRRGGRRSLSSPRRCVVNRHGSPTASRIPCDDIGRACAVHLGVGVL